MTAPRISSFASRARRLVAISRRVLAKAHDDLLGLRSSALAFVTILALVPLLGVVSFFLAETLRADVRTMRIVAGLLPYPQEEVVAALQGFVAQAARVRGFGFAGFLGISLFAFFMLEESIQRIFAAPTRPSLPRRLLSFALLVFWGPLVIGAAYSALLYFYQRPDVGPGLRASALSLLAPIFVVWIALTMLFWLVPNRHVRLQNAASGALAAAILLALLQHAFRLYVIHMGTVQRVVYGGFAIALFFVISVELAWWIVLVGCETAASLELGLAGGATPVPWPAEARPWIAAAALAVLAERAADGTRTTPAAQLRERLGVTQAELAPALAPALDRGWVAAPAGDVASYRLAVDAQTVRLTALFAALEDPLADRLAHRADALPAGVHAIRERLVRAERAALGDATLADLARPLSPEDTQAVR